MNRIDELFKSKLEDIQVFPSIEVWDKIKIQLPVKQNRSGKMYWKIAASILAIFLVSYVIWSIGYNAGIKSADTLVSDQFTAQNIPPDKLPNENNSLLLQSKKPNSEKNEETQIPLAEKSIKRNNSLIAKLPGKKLPESQLPHLVPELLINRVPETNSDLIAIAEARITDESELPSVTIIYKPGITDEDDESKLKKAWNYAVGLKNGDEKIPSIRNMKNDLLAFNSKRKRSKNQNNESF